MFEQFFDRALREAAEDVLERMFFIRVAGEPPPADSGLAPEITARIAFEGSPPGWLTLRVGKAAAHSITADFLGEEEETVTDQQAEDMVCELANMICGSVLSRTEWDAAFHLSSPQVAMPEDLPDPSDAAEYRIALGNGTLAILMKAEAATCPPAGKFAS
jgi:CheY-specific phosphatase CheX